jgi:hypothetical protein
MARTALKNEKAPLIWIICKFELGKILERGDPDLVISIDCEAESK